MFVGARALFRSQGEGRRLTQSYQHWTMHRVPALTRCVSIKNQEIRNAWCSNIYVLQMSVDTL